MNRVEAAQKQWFDREVADRAEAEAWARQREAARATLLPPKTMKAEVARPDVSEPELGWWQRLRRAMGLEAHDRAPTPGAAR